MTNRITGATPSTKQTDYERVLAAIKHALAEGLYEGGMLPSYRQLVRNLNVGMASVRRAMAQLEREGLIKRETGRGTFPCRPRKPAASPKAVSLQCINVVIPRLPSFLEADYLKGYTEALDHRSIRMRFVTDEEEEADYYQLFSPELPLEVQGVVLLNESCTPKLVEWLQSNDVPFVVQYFARYATKDLPAHFGVYVNKPDGAFQAVSHLLELGHRDIGFMGTEKPGFPQDNMVFEGYRAALICAGLDCTEDNLIKCDCPTREKDAIFAIAKDFLQYRRRPTAVLAVCDEFALSLLDAAYALGLRVPEDLSIVGFDNQPESAKADPPLTTVSVPRRELAKNAISLLLEAAKRPRVAPRTSILRTHLIIRATTASPRDTHSEGSAASIFE